MKPAGPEEEATHATDAASEAGAAPGYLPRLLSAAAYVSQAACDRVLERFGLSRSSYGLLEHLAAEPAPAHALAAATGRLLPAVEKHLMEFRSAGYAVPDGSATWAVTDAGARALECAQLAESEADLVAEDSRELREALRCLIASLRRGQPNGQIPS